MPSNPLPPRFRDRYFVPDDYKKLTLEAIEEPRDPPSVGIFDLPYRCYIVNEEWDKHISGAVSVLTEWRAWNGDEDDRDSSVQAILEFLAQDGECSVAQLQVRQSPTDPCILESSVDSGENWLEFADILECITQEFLEQSIISALNTNTDIQTIIEQLTDGGTDNDLPPMPTSSEPDKLCDAAYYMVDKIIEFIDDTLTDASTITLEEFLEALLQVGGWIADLLKLFWDFIVANSYPDLLTDVQAAREEVAEILYCNELDKETVVSLIDSSATIGEEAQAAFIGAINALTDGKWALWAFVGSEVDSGESCSGFCGEPEGGTLIVTFDEEGYQDYVVIEGGEDGSFGNPLPSGDGAYNSGIDTFRNRTRVNLPFVGTVKRIEFDAWSNQNPWSYNIHFFDDEDNQLTTTGIVGQTVTGSWLHFTIDSLDVDNCAYVRFTVGASGDGHDIHVDNLEIEYDID